MPPRFPGLIAVALIPAESAARLPDTRQKLNEEIAVVFDQFRNPLLRYLWTFRLDIHDSEEVLQDVFLSLFQHRDRGKPVDNVRAWLFRVAHNLALRRSNRTLRCAETQLDAAGEQWTVDPAPNPEDRLASIQNHKRIAAVVAALPEQDRQCLFLRAEGLRYREIADILDMSLGAVSLSLTRSLSRIARSAESRKPV